MGAAGPCRLCPAAPEAPLDPGIARAHGSLTLCSGARPAPPLTLEKAQPLPWGCSVLELPDTTGILGQVLVFRVWRAGSPRVSNLPVPALLLRCGIGVVFTTHPSDAPKITSGV